jgi:hypothetical protein
MVGLPVQYLNNRSHGKNLMSTPGQAKPTAKYFPYTGLLEPDLKK